MQRQTVNALRGVLSMDPTLSANHREKALRRITDASSNEARPDPDKILRRCQVAERMNRSLRFVDDLAAQGILPRVRMPGRVRGLGFRSRDVDALMQEGGGREA